MRVGVFNLNDYGPNIYFFGQQELHKISARGSHGWIELEGGGLPHRGAETGIKQCSMHDAYRSDSRPSTLHRGSWSPKSYRFAFKQVRLYVTENTHPLVFTCLADLFRC